MQNLTISKLKFRSIAIPKHNTDSNAKLCNLENDVIVNNKQGKSELIIILVKQSPSAYITHIQSM